MKSLTKIGLGVVMAATALCGAIRLSPAHAAETEIKPAPAFTGKDLTALPRDSWITNGGNIFNQRYSPLDQINRANVKDLKALWQVHMGSGNAQANSGETQILEYEGVLYVGNSANDVFAVDVETGNILWTYHGNPNFTNVAGIGHISRGVALGDGKVFVGQLDSKVVALDQRTGKVVWTNQIEPAGQGYSITMAPLYFDGMVMLGFNGSEMGLRGWIKALDAKTGKLVWTFNTIPGPGEFGHDTWPKDSDAWIHGGGAVWQTPAADPSLGLVYFATGNAAPDMTGYVRPGNNLFTVSVIAVDAKTGKYRWHFQEVHHDMWDYDAANPVVLFDAPFKGKTRKAIAQVGKTGFTYILDRATGKPLIGIVEKPVPQEPRQKTAKTQPYPVGEAVVPQEVLIRPEGSVRAPGTTHTPNYGRIFSPFWTDPIVMKPGSNGGANWPPSSYDPDTHLLYVCATDRAGAYRVAPKLDDPAPGKTYMGGSFTQTAAQGGGIFAAVNLTTNKLAWRQQWPEICFSGSIATKGGLVFVGRSDGRLTALDKANGDKLWEFMTDAGVNTTATTFEWKGKQYLVVQPGGGVFANGRRGDSIWMFSLDGKMGPYVQPVAAGGAGRGGAAAPAGGGRPNSAPQAAAARALDLANGEKLYKESCTACHGDDGAGGRGGGANLTAGTLTPATAISVVAAGKNNMPPFREVYSLDQITDIAGYVTTVLAKKR